MKLFRHTLGVVLLASATCSQAVTLKYELTNIHSFGTSVMFPGLEFGNATSAYITVEKTMEKGTELKSLELNFPQINKLSATGFTKGDSDFYQTTVANAWVYRGVDLRVHTQDLTNNSSLMIEGFVSTKAAFISNNTQSEEPAQLFFADGMLKDITPRRVADTATTTINGKRLTLTLKDRLGTASTDSNPSGANEGFVVDLMWLGKGQKTVYLPSPFGGEMSDFVTAISLNILGTDNPDTQTWEVQITCLDQYGNEFIAPPMNLLEILNQAYPQQP